MLDGSVFSVYPECVKPAEVRGIGTREMISWVLSETEDLLSFHKGSFQCGIYLLCLVNRNYGLTSVPKNTAVGLGLLNSLCSPT